MRYRNPAADVTLAGTLTVPRGSGPFPAVLLIGGSGQFPRDQPFFGHKMFLVLADYLTRRGIAVLRTDDRGAGESSAGTKPLAELTTDDFAADTRAGVEFLRSRPEIDRRRIGLIAHSEGTEVASILAAESPEHVYFMVLLAAASASMTKGDIVAAQSRAMARGAGLSAKAQAADREFVERALVVVKQEPDAAIRTRRIGAIAAEVLPKVPAPERAVVEPGMRARVEILASENFHQDAVRERRDRLAEVRAPVLALNGDKDVLVSADDNVPLLRQSLRRGGNPTSSARVLAGLNHMFQTARTGMMEEAKDIEETFAPPALRLIAEWIGDRTR